MKNTEELEKAWRSFEKRYKEKKLLNLAISFIIISTGVFSVNYIWHYDKDGILTFRWMTVDGTVFTVLMTTLYVVVNLIELIKKTEMTRKTAYFAKLSSAVAECIIITVVLLSQLPFSPDHMHITRPDMFCMHILIPVLSVASFVINDSPIGKLRFGELLLGTAFVTCYALVMIPLILTGIITNEQIPYFFLDFRHMAIMYIAGCFLFIYGIGYLWSLALSRLNRKLYWLWFKNIAG